MRSTSSRPTRSTPTASAGSTGGPTWCSVDHDVRRAANRAALLAPPVAFLAVFFAWPVVNIVAEDVVGHVVRELRAEVHAHPLGADQPHHLFPPLPPRVRRVSDQQTGSESGRESVWTYV